MARINPNLGSVVYVVVDNETVVLRPGDEVPTGVEVGDHVLDSKEDANGKSGNRRAGRRATPKED